MADLHNILRLKKSSTVNECGLVSTVEIVNSRLKQQEERCQHLQTALRQQQRHSRRILDGEYKVRVAKW